MEADGSTVPAERIWSELRSRIRQVLDSPTFELWFDPLEPVGHVGTTLYLTGPDHVIAWVERRYSGLLDSLEPTGDTLRVILTKREAAAGEAGSGDLTAGEVAIGSQDKCFENFIVGNENRLAHGAALAVAEAPGEAYNPLFLHGPPGLGKSHLLLAIAGYVSRTRPELRIVVTNAERFTREFVSAVQARSVESFKKRHRDVDLLLIDDVQFLEGKERTADELFHTFDALHGTGSQLVFSADRIPSELSTLELRLRERFEWGLTVELGQPDRATREAFLRNRVKSPGQDLDPRLIEHLADRPAASLRAVEASLTRVRAEASLMGLEPGAVEVDDLSASPSRTNPQTRVVSVEEIQRLVSERFGIDIEEMLSTGRTARLSRPRQMAMHLTRQLTGLSLPAIAKSFRRSDHTTVLHALKSVEKRIAEDPATRSTMDELAESLRGKARLDRVRCENRTPQQSLDPQPNYNPGMKNIREIS